VRLWYVPLLALVAGCFYVSKKEYRGYWDADGDGWPVGDDCAPDDSGIFPYGPDFRGDQCDSDCRGAEDDQDQDDWPDDADCAPTDPLIYPCAADRDDDTIDSDCDGFTTQRQDTCLGTDPDWPDALPITECPQHLVTAGGRQ
jgi:hypothetical protein